ncbi:MAG: DUF488 domain-containing protein [Chloroflexi bacterium]|nr:DUF488 domain-containing protein [Chloroflexota bacterium]MCI0645591.1 DUF488 domain-containing protein [Chloroflexota bacterium]
MTSTPIYTIGYGAREIEAFVAALQAHGVAYLIDVRSRPYSRYKPDFSKDALAQHLKEHGIRYVFMGDMLGGRPADADCYRADGKVDYDKVGQKPFYQEGIGRLREAWEQQLRVAIMCSEGKPEQCHRAKLIGETLVKEGIGVAHIDENNQLVSQVDVQHRLNKGQPSLFGPDFQPATSRKRYRPEEEESEL